MASLVETCDSLLLMPWTASIRRHLGVTMVVHPMIRKRLFMAINGSHRHTADTSAYPPASDIPSDDVRYAALCRRQIYFSFDFDEP